MAKSKTKREKEETSEPDPNLYFGYGEFVLPNGDKYNGNYCAHKYGILWREGYGTYTTQDGQTYEGEWRDDKLVEQKEVVIKYPSGEEYRGTLSQDKYSGVGAYTLNNKMVLNCEFFDNKPRENVILIDINGRIWQGKAGENSALLLPENEFYNSISEGVGIGKFKEKYTQKISSETAMLVEDNENLSSHDKEKNVFTKSTKTLYDVDFTDSKWCQRYLRYKTMKESAIKFLKNRSRKSDSEEECQEEDEEVAAKEEDKIKKWLDKYQKHKCLLKEKNKDNFIKRRDSIPGTSLLDKFYSKEYQKSFPALKVFHPSCDWKEQSMKSGLTETEEENVEDTVQITEVDLNVVT